MAHHEWIEFSLTPVHLISAEGMEPRFVADPEAEPFHVYGCQVCNMGEHEAMTSACPGYDIFAEAAVE